ncbi:MAG TPA: V-type ATP synthase subunit F [Thermodesulfovibrionales bacterium]|nr:V-type ATP synthase subunit F [Thermodesulfovibrionales bacterium]
MKKIVVITPRGHEYGFGLAGVNHYTIGADELEVTLTTLMRDAETGLVVIDERLIKGITREKLREMEKRWYGILLVLPAPEKLSAEVEDYAVSLIKRAIGYHVKVHL